jgi:hypothetical protein
MEIFDFSRKKDDMAGYMVSINKREAYQLMQSLATQLANENPNSGRVEHVAELATANSKKKKRVYFSISVSR